MPDNEPTCTCTPFTQDAGGGHFEHLLEPDPTCQIHFPHDMVPLSHGGHLSFDGAEGIAFWLSEGEDHDEESVRVMFEDLDKLRTFIAHWFPSTPPAGCNCGLDHRIPTKFGGTGRG